MALSDWLFAGTRQTHQFALERLFDLLYRGLVEALGVPANAAGAALAEDYRSSGAKGCPEFLRSHSVQVSRQTVPRLKSGATPNRQARHR